MSRVLAQSTVIRALKRRGWHWDGQWFRFMPYGNVQVVGEFWAGAGLKFFDARAKGRPNVHVESYWGAFRSVAEMEQQLDKVEETYRELCGAFFPERGQP